MAHVQFISPADEEGWRTPARLLRDPPPPRDCDAISFTVENPASSKVWDDKSMRSFAFADWPQAPTDEVARAAMRDPSFAMTSKRRSIVTTSYCSYGFGWKKDTSILSNLSNLRLRPPCRVRPCGRVHTEFASLTTVQRNSIPKLLVSEMLEAFEAAQRASGRVPLLVVDVFAGWGSVSDEAQQRGLLVFSNDILPNRCNANIDFDMRDIQLSDLIVLALRHHEQHVRERLDPASFETLFDSSASIKERLSASRVGVLLHLSFPCTTYSTAAGGHHRLAGSSTALTPTAVAHDQMLASVICELESLC